ncbi:acyl-CoA dehydrogenase [Zavarzinia aquatilis]|uniref:3-methylmercaptopropionyl-CoA dehydrogenase n=1 Tax=Zavarzinia aquatilis TaxID=2211142 RepID=A0A317ECA5_9PROT|nr:acyl-CoA dehydrogenase [Zavarzinia aquatilis]PWR22835.1 acyl-CoA dehydrogenase [Zavarzinia aquatilis]
MTVYSAPSREMMFTLETIGRLQDISGFELYEHATPEVVEQVLEEAGKLARDVIAPTNPIGDKQGAKYENGKVTLPKEFEAAWKAYTEGGWPGVPFEFDFGGQSLPWTITVAVSELWSSSNMAFGLIMLLNQGATEAIHAHGTEEQKATYLEKMIAGEWTGTMNLTEPQAGSDLGEIKSRATPAADGSWRIKGQKIFITFGEHDLSKNIIHLVLAKTPGAPAGSKGISCFIVPKYLINADGSLGARNDVRCVSIEHKIGIHGSPTCVMAFGDNDDCVGYMIGKENRGLQAMFTMMNNARLSVGVQGLGLAERAYQQALAFAQERRQSRALGAASPSAIIEHPDVRRMLFTMRSTIDAMRALVCRNALAIDLSKVAATPEERTAERAMADLLTPITKSWCTDKGTELTSLNIQIHGGMGFIEETGAAQHWRDSRIAPIYEGTNGIQAIDLVTRKVTLHGGDTVRGLIAEIESVLPALETAAGTDFKVIASHLAPAAQAFAQATEWVLANVTNSPNEVLATASVYLDMAAQVVGGWLLARQALAAGAKLNEDGADVKFLRARIASARFFAEQRLPVAASLLGPVTTGNGLLADLPELLIA